MARALASAIGIDIGTHTIKIAELRAGRDRHSLTGVAIVPTPREGVDQTGVFEPGCVAAAIRNAATEAGLSVKQGVLGISGQASVVVRMLEVPKMTPSELKEHMQWEIQRNIPFAESTIVSDYARVQNPDDPPDSQQMDVVLAVAPQSAIDTSVALMEGSGLNPVGIDVQPLALSRVLCLDGAAASGSPVMIVNVGASMTSIDVFRFGNLSFPRMLPLGGNSFTQAIADGLGITVDEAEVLKLDKGEVLLEYLGLAGGGPPGAPAPSAATQGFQPYNPYVDESDQGPAFEVEPEVEPQQPSTVTDDVTSAQPESIAERLQEPPPPPPPPAPAVPMASHDPQVVSMFNALQPTLEELTSEVRRSVEYFRGRGAGQEISKILLAGGGSKLKGLDKFFASAFGVDVEYLDPWESISIAARRQPESFLREHSAELAVAIGMALHAFEE